MKAEPWPAGDNGRATMPGRRSETPSIWLRRVRSATRISVMRLCAPQLGSGCVAQASSMSGRAAAALP